MLLSVCDSVVTRRVLLERSCSHPWLSERCRNAVAVKQVAFGTDTYAAQCLLSTTVLREELSCYVSAVKQRLCRLRSGSKQFWSLSKKLSLIASTTSAIPTLKTVMAAGYVQLVRKQICLLKHLLALKSC